MPIVVSIFGSHNDDSRHALSLTVASRSDEEDVWRA